MRTEQIKYPDQYCVFDTETTGLDVDRDLILEIAALKVTKNPAGEYQAEKKSWLINWEAPVPEKITEITGITTKLVQDHGIFPAHALKEFMQFSGLSEFAMPLVGHNIYRFDLPMLFNNLKRTFPGELERLGAIENFALELSVDTAAVYKASKLAAPRYWSEDAYTYGVRVMDEKVFGLKYNLGVVSGEYGITMPAGLQQHRAEGDVYLTNEVYKKLCLS